MASFLDSRLGLDQLAASLHIPLDSLKAAAVLLGTYVFALLFDLIPSKGPASKTAKHYFSVVASCTLFFLLFTFGGFVEMIGMSLLTYVACYFQRSQKKTPILVFIYLMTHLSWKHIYNQFIAPTSVKFDNTTPVMVLVMKLSAFAWSAYDGTLPDEVVPHELKSRAIRRFPSILEFFGYIFFFGSFFTGPAFDFRDYQMFIEGEGPFAKIPNRIIPTLKCFGYVLPCFYVFVRFSNQFTFEKIADAEYIEMYSWWQRILLILAAGFIARMRFYIAWKLSEGVCNLTGIGYTGVDPNTGNHVWERCQNIDILGFEFASNSKAVFDAWNQKTSLWLRNCIYYRTAKPGQKPGGFATLLTYLVSAFWHGFYPGYYLSFFAGAILNLTARTLRRSLRPIFLAPSKLSYFKSAYDFMGWITTLLFVNYFVAAINLRTVEATLAYWRALYFVPVVTLSLTYTCLNFFGGSKLIERVGISIGALYPEVQKKLN